MPNEFAITKHYNATGRSIAVIFHFIQVILIILVVVIVLPLTTAFKGLRSGGCLAALATLRSRFDLLLGLLVLNECAKDTDLVILVGLKVEAELLTETKLEKVVVKGLFGYSNFRGGIL